MQTHLVKLLLLLTFFITGCRPSTESERRAQLEKFNEMVNGQRKSFEVSFPLGTMRSRVIIGFGRPISTTTNFGSDDKLVADYYMWSPHDGGLNLSTNDSLPNGFSVIYSNNAEIKIGPVLNLKP